MTSGLLKPDVVARAEALGLKARTLVEGMRVGDHKSPYHGFSVEFIQHREYVPGDDIRHIDWRVYGRNERYAIKQYEQETNFIGHLVVDGSRSMHYGEGDANKLEVAKVIAATLAHMIIGQRDSASLHIFDEGFRKQIPHGSSPGHFQEILKALEGAVSKDKTAMGPLLHSLAEKVRRRGLVFLISDCFDEPASILEGLRHLRFMGHEITVFHVLHPDETQFQFEGMVKFDALEDVRHLLTRPRLLRPSYLRALEAYLKELREGCDGNRVDYVPVDTSKPLSETLTAYLARRLKVRRI